MIHAEPSKPQRRKAMSNDNVIAKEARALLTAVKYTGLKNLGELPGASADAGMGYEARVPEAFVARLESALGGDGSSAGATRLGLMTSSTREAREETPWTKGPWECAPELDFRLFTTVFPDARWSIWQEDDEAEGNSFPIAVIDCSDDHCAETRRRAEHNARLIAAAPSLYEALSAFVKQWRTYKLVEPLAPGNDRDFPSITMLRESWERAEAALAKACPPRERDGEKG